MPGSTENQALTAQETTSVVSQPVLQSGTEQVSPTGERQVFRALRRQLTDDDLANSGVQKLILHMLEQAENDRDEAEGFRQRFNDSEKNVAVLQEKAKSAKAVDVAYGVGTGIGGAMIGAAFYFWGKTPPDYLAGGVIFGFGILLFIGGVVIKAIKEK